jgi:hypothetical protein
MKKIIIVKVITLIVIFFLTSCEKIQRGQYTGSWDFVVEKVSGSDYDGWRRDTTYYLGKVKRDIVYNKLIIEYMKDTKIVMNVNECGELHKDFEDPYEFASGQFYGDDNVQIKLGWRAQGGGYYHIIDGIKQRRR